MEASIGSNLGRKSCISARGGDDDAAGDLGVDARLIFLPRDILTTSILPFTTSQDWLSFRLISQSCYEIVHGNKEFNGVHNSVRNECYCDDSNEADSDADDLWRLALARDFQFHPTNNEGVMLHSIRSPPLGSDGAAFLSTDGLFVAKSAFVSWKYWRKIDRRLHRGQYCRESERIVGPYFIRAARLWKKIEDWCDSPVSGSLGDGMRSSLLPGRPLDPNLLTSNGGEFEAKLSALKAVYSFYAGQMTPSHSESESNVLTRGLFGGISAYDIVSNMHWTNPVFCTDSFELVIAYDCFRVHQKRISLHLPSGRVFCVTRAGSRLATPHVDSLDVLSGANDSILRWFEEHARRLNHGYLSVGQLFPRASGMSLLQYPSRPDTTNCSRAVTRGVEIIASAVFVPEVNIGGPGRGAFVYSIRMRILTPEDDREEYMSPEARGFQTCQLRSRYLRIHQYEDDSVNPKLQEVHGEGVVGEYPLLREGGYQNFFGDGLSFQNSEGWFSYQSCTDGKRGMFQGELEFVPGSLRDPQGEVFRAQVDAFPLCAEPKYFY